MILGLSNRNKIYKTIRICNHDVVSNKKQLKILNFLNRNPKSLIKRDIDLKSLANKDFLGFPTLPLKLTKKYSPFSN